MRYREGRNFWKRAEWAGKWKLLSLVKWILKRPKFFLFFSLSCFPFLFFCSFFYLRYKGVLLVYHDLSVLLESKGWLQIDRHYSLHKLWTGDLGKFCFVLPFFCYFSFFLEKKEINTFMFVSEWKLLSVTYILYIIYSSHIKSKVIFTRKSTYKSGAK